MNEQDYPLVRAERLLKTMMQGIVRLETQIKEEADKETQTIINLRLSKKATVDLIKQAQAKYSPAMLLLIAVSTPMYDYLNDNDTTKTEDGVTTEPAA